MSTHVLTNTWYISDDARAPDFEFVPPQQQEAGGWRWPWWTVGHDAIQPGSVYVVHERGTVEGTPFQVLPGQPPPEIGSPFWLRNSHYRLSLWDAARPR